MNTCGLDNETLLMKCLNKYFINNLSNDNLDFIISEIIEEYYL